MDLIGAPHVQGMPSIPHIPVGEGGGSSLHCIIDEDLSTLNVHVYVRKIKINVDSYMYI